MAKRRQKLKLFRTPIGFHDAFVAAPSRKAALEAWGAGTDLFSAGIAEEVQDDALLDRLSKRPGDVARRPRGDLQGTADLKPAARKAGRGSAKSPKPSRTALDKAESAVAELEREHAEALEALQREEQVLAKRRSKLERSQSAAMDKAIARRDKAEATYRRALQR